MHPQNVVDFFPHLLIEPALEHEVITEVSTSEKEIICLKCKGADTVKDGIRHTKHGADIQRYSCNDCHFRFIISSGFEHARADGKVITAAGICISKASHLAKYVTT